MNKLRVSLAAVALSVPLAGCISFGAKPPASLMTLTATAQVPAGQVQSTAAATSSITVLVPSTPQSLATARVPVQATPTTVAYVKDALWVEPPARLFARVLSDTIGARTGRIVVGTEQAYADPGARLTGELRSFGLDAATSAAVVTYDAALVRADGKGVEKRRFTASVPVAVIDAASAGPALNQAANQIAGEVADWVGR